MANSRASNSGINLRERVVSSTNRLQQQLLEVVDNLQNPLPTVEAVENPINALPTPIPSRPSRTATPIPSRTEPAQV